MTQADPSSSSPRAAAQAGSGEGDVLARPIIVIGAPRSGTSLLSETLGRHRDVRLFTEPRLTWRYGNDARSDMLSPAHARPEVIAYIRETFAEQVREAGKRRMLEKTPANALRPAFVDRVFPDCRFIHIIRDPIESVLAIRSFWDTKATGYNIAPGRVRERLKEVKLRQLPHYGKEIVRRSAPKFMRGAVGRNVWGPRLPGIQQMLKEIDLLDICAMQWRMCTELTATFGRRLPADRYYECKLEELSHDHLKRMLAFAELDDDPAVHDYFTERFNPDRVGGRSDSADPADVERILELTEAARFWLGYA